MTRRQVSSFSIVRGQRRGLYKMHTQDSSSKTLMGMRIVWRAYTELCVIQLHVLLLPTALRLFTDSIFQS